MRKKEIQKKYKNIPIQKANYVKSFYYKKKKLIIISTRL